MGTHIAWTEVTRNVMTGCDKYSQGCVNCYAKRQAEKLRDDPNPRTAGKYANGFRFTVHPESLDALERELRGWRKPHKVFVNSMSDTFHEEAPEDFIRRLFEIMQKYPRHTFQVLTKRAERMAELAGRLPWPRNVWAGVTVESAQYVERLNHLRTVPARVRWISFEPLLGPIPEIDLTGIHWAVIGGESGPNSRKMDLQWARDIRDQLMRARVPFWFKQVGGEGRDKGGHFLDGNGYWQYPDVEVEALSQIEQLTIFD